MKFLGFSKIWDEILKIYFISKIFFFFLKIYFERKFSPDFGKPQKFHDLVFVFYWVWAEIFSGGKRFRQDSNLIPLHSPISRFLCLKNTFFHHISFITSLVTSKINVGSNLLNCPRSAENAPNDNPVAFGLYSLQSF